MTTTAPSARPSDYHPMSCPSWCEVPEHAHVEDGTDHLRVLGTLAATLGDPVDLGGHFGIGGVRVSLCAEDGAHRPSVSVTAYQPVGPGEDDVRWAELDMTAVEARRLAAALVAAADLLDREGQR